MLAYYLLKQMSMLKTLHHVAVFAPVVTLVNCLKKNLGVHLWSTVINLITPALNKYLPIRNYTMSVLALSALCAILDNRNQAVYKSSIETIIDEIVNAGFMLTQKLNTIDANILSHAQTIYNEKKITFIGEDIDFAQAYLSNLLLSKYTQKQGQLYKTSDISNTDCVILFSSIHNRTHTTIKNAISNNDLQAKSLCNYGHIRKSQI